MNSRQRATLRAIFERPTRTDVRWSDIESLLKGLGAEVEEGKGSRVRVRFKGRKAVYHRPHPKPTAKEGLVEQVRDLLRDVED